ncbi:MAG: endonuclease/exonuclease/phosphatase family protein [Flavobacteriales bacterium]|nr:endonuclease/exonuclease/phosphatase family protein [Flavobacteriales bacterium]
MQVKIFNSNWRQMPLFLKLLAYLSILSNLFLVLTYLNYLIPPTISWFNSLIGLAYPIIVLVNIFFLFFWLLKKELFFLYSLIVLILGFYHHSRYLQITPINTKIKGHSKEIKVMSYNVRLFDLYNWTENKKTRDLIIQQIKKVNPDVICFQEYYYSSKLNFQTRDLIINELNMNYYHENFSHESKKDSKFGIATFSKFPIIESDFISFENDKSNQCIWTDINIDKDTLRVYNAHLGSIRFNYSDYKIIGGKGSPLWPYQQKPTRQIFKRLKLGFQKRQEQISLLIPQISKSPHKTIICSDINDTPLSYAYHQFDKYFTDSFTKSANGIEGTYIGNIPGLRIDYIWHSKELKSTNFTTHQEKLSDHKAISASIYY